MPGVVPDDVNKKITVRSSITSKSSEEQDR
jgi:hypothetical protein